MSTTQETNIAVSFYNIHNIITRGLKVSIESIQEAIQSGFKDTGRRTGIFTFIRTLSIVLNSHHLTEDEVVFPYFREKMPDAPFDVLIKWHQEMVDILGDIQKAVDKCDRDGWHEAELKDLENVLTRLNESWHPHIKMETDEFILKADALLPVQEQLSLIQSASEHGQKNSEPPFLTVPFMLYNLPMEDRKVFSHGMPAELLENLVPIVWKEKWESMAPYLLT